jgi:peptidyl-prolyl cis-trans isomerase D
MTMLDRMRRHRNWLKWSLALVVLAFVIFYIPDLMPSPTGDVAAAGTVAVVEGHEISADEFRRSYQAQLAAYRSAYGENMNDQLLRQLGVEHQVLQQMVDERAALSEAERLGLRVSDEEVRQRILTLPAFQENGAFIGEARYRQLLAMQRPPMTPNDFEETMRRALLVDKLRASITGWLSIPDQELAQEYRRRNDKIKLAVASFPADSFRTQISVADADLAAYFDAHPEEFRIPEKRKLRYVLVDVEALRSKVEVSQADLERAYAESSDVYSTPEEIRASHILLKTEGQDAAAVRAKAEELLKQARAGADFAALAKQHSQDEGTAPLGGDLDFFGRGRMVPEFDAAAFALEPGQISDVVQTQYGFHIIKVTEKKPATTRSLDDMRQQLTDQIAFERAQTQAGELAERLRTQIARPADLDTAAQANGLVVQDSGLFARDEPIGGLGAAPDLAAQAFQMTDSEVVGPVSTPRGFVFASLAEKRDSYLPKIDEVRERVRDVVILNRAREMSREKAQASAARLKSADNFEAAAKAAGAEARTTDLITRESPLPELGPSTDVLDQAFALPQGAVSDPATTETGTAIVKVLEKQETTAADLAANRERFRNELLTDRRNRFFAAYMDKAKEKMRIQLNQDAVQRIVG